MSTPKKSRTPRQKTTAAKEHESPKTTRPEAIERRPAAQKKLSQPDTVGQHKLDAFPDRIDVRDWFYQPGLHSLPDTLVNCDSTPFILDQGSEGACTGFALAAVIHFLLAARNLRREISPRMIYEMARRYDEWPGEQYDGSSARGAMKGWIAHGVCSREKWPDDLSGPGNLNEEMAAEATGTPGGAYYRVMHRNVRDMHAALAEVGILYATLMVHDGWLEPGPKSVTVHYAENGNARTRTLPIIARKGRSNGGHAIAIVGYTRDGFVIQNSWGPDWGADGFALLPYEDYMLHATDVWVAQLGVPIATNAWDVAQGADSRGISRAARIIPLSEIRPHVIDVGNNGELSDSGHYWTTQADLQRLFSETIPNATRGWKKRRILLYLHGGLNAELDVAKRIVAFRDVLRENEIYPVHIMWETGHKESVGDIIQDLFTDADERASSWFSRLREGLTEAKDRTFELTTAALGGALWGEMKENAALASLHREGLGGMQLVAKYVEEAMQGRPAAERKKWELHVVGHSAGSIFAAHGLEHLVGLGLTFKTLQFMAPAITVELFKKLVIPLVEKGDCPHPSMYLLSDDGERDDTVGPYGKSLLYLVSNAFERKRGTPLLGMERFVRRDPAEPSADVDPAMEALFKKKVDGRPSLIVAGIDEGPGSRSSSDSHGGFDNDPDTLNAVIRRILDLKDTETPKREFEVRDLQY